MNYSALKSVKAGVLQIVHLIAATLFGAMLDGLQALLSNKTLILDRLAKADVNDAYSAALFLATSGTRIVTFINADGASNLGLELEARTGLGRLSAAFDPLTFFTNVTAMRSRIRCWCNY